MFRAAASASGLSQSSCSMKITVFHTLKVCVCFLSTGTLCLFSENLPCQQGLNWDISVVPCDCSGVFDSLTGRAPTCCVPTLQSSSSVGSTRDCSRTFSRVLGESVDLWKHEENECAPSFLNQVHVVESYLVDHDVAVRAGSLKSSKPDAIMLISTPAPSPAPPVSAQGDLHINTITGETLVFQLCMCGSGLWSASLQKVCHTRVQPSPSSAVHCRSDHPKLFVRRIPEWQIVERIQE